MQKTGRFSILFNSILAALCFSAGFSAFGAEVIWDVVADKGVVPADAKPGVDAAIDDALTYLSNNVSDTLVLYFPEGTYEFHHPTQRGMEIHDSNSGRLVFRGAGPDLTTLRFDQFDNIAIHVEDSRNVTFEQMHVTRTGLYTTQGDVVAVTNGQIQFQLHPGFPDPVWLFFAGTAAENERTLLEFRGSALEPEFAPEADKILLTNMVALGGDVYAADMQNPAQVHNLVPGDKVALKSKCGHQTFRMVRTDDCTIQDVRITRAAGNPIRMPYGGNNLVVRRVTIDRAEPINGVTPFFSGPGGGIQLYADEIGPTVEECVIIGTADDGIGIFSSSYTNLTVGTVVRRNIISDNQARGILITQSDGGICEQNTMIRNHDNTFRIKVESHDGITDAGTAAVRNWTFKNNAIFDPWVGATFRFDEELPCGLHDNVVIESNLVVRASKNNNVIQIDNAEDIIIRNNEITSFSAEEDIQKWNSSDAILRVEGAVTVSGSSNMYFGALNRPELDKQDTSAIVTVGLLQSDLLRIPASEDAFVDSKSPDRNQGASAFMKTDNGVGRQWLGLIKFNVASVPKKHRVVSAKLRVMPSDFSLPLDTPLVYGCGDNDWTEMGVTWSNKPAIGGLLAVSSNRFVAGNLVEFDVTQTVTSNGTYSFYLHNSSDTDESRYASRENSLFLGPELLLETEPLPVATNPVAAVEYTGLSLPVAIFPIRSPDVNTPVQQLYRFDETPLLFNGAVSEGQRVYGAMKADCTTESLSVAGPKMVVGGRFIIEAESIGATGETYLDAFYLWDKRDFKNGAENTPMAFDASTNSYLAVDLFRNDGDARFVIRNGANYFVSGRPMAEGLNQILYGTNTVQWAAWNPASNGGTGFSEIPLSGYASRTFNDVTGVGIVVNGAYRFGQRSARFTILDTIAGGPGFIAHLVPSALSPYESWAQDYGLLLGSDGDDDGDGVINLHEFAIGGDPTNSLDVGYWPMIYPRGGSVVEYVYFRQKETFEPGLVYELEHTEDLLSNVWTNSDFIFQGSGSVDFWMEAVTNQLPVSDTPSQFIRLRIGEE